MPIDAIVLLEQLRCITLKNTESKVEPYIWPALIKFDNTTINAPDKRFVDIITLSPDDSLVKIKDSMRAGETAPIPARVGTLRTRFADGTTLRGLILIVTLLEMDESPKDAMRAGFLAFASELRAAFKDEFPKLFQADSVHDEEGKKVIVDRLKKRVGDKVRSAIKDELSITEKAKIKLGFLDTDDDLGTAVAEFTGDPLLPKPFTLAYEVATKTVFLDSLIKFEIQGRLQLQQPAPPDPCKAQVDAVRAAQATVDGLIKEIANLGKNSDPPLSKVEIRKETERIKKEELAPAEEKLKKAKAALQLCRDRHKLADVGVVGVLTTR